MKRLSPNTEQKYKWELIPERGEEKDLEDRTREIELENTSVSGGVKGTNGTEPVSK